jgi:hypothetical protein
MCDISKGKNAISCKNAVSGLKAIYLANYDNYGFITSSTTVGQVLTDLGALTEVFKYELKNSANSIQEDMTSNRDNGTTFFQQVVNFTLTKVSKEMAFQIKMMAWGRPQIFVETMGGDFILLGKENGLEISGNAQVGGTMDSLNGYVLTGTGMEREPMFFLDETSVAALKLLVSAINIE